MGLASRAFPRRPVRADAVSTAPPRSASWRPIRRRPRLAAATGVVIALTAATAALTTVPAQAAAGCRVDYQVSNQWPGGFSATVNVTNLGDPVPNWRLTWSFTAGQSVSQLWGGKSAQTGARVTVDNATWNGSVGTGASAWFGFNGSWNGSNPVPADFAFNGVLCTGGPPTTTTSTTTTTTTTSVPPSDVLSQAHTAGRVKTAGGAVQYTWPGVYFEGRFRGTGIGVVLNDADNDYDIQVDGVTVATLVTPGRTTRTVNGLTDAEHTVRLVKRTESPWAAGEFGGFVAGPGGRLLSKPAARSRQIEFIGDSLTAGYGNLSTTRDCSANGGVNRNTNTNLSFGALTARDLGADYQVNAQSGRGMVRNYNGGEPGTSFRTYYDRALQHVPGDVWQNPGTWRPQLVVVGLGTNDFSTAVNPGEPWTQESLVTAYKDAYQGFQDAAERLAVIQALAAGMVGLAWDHRQQGCEALPQSVVDLPRSALSRRVPPVPGSTGVTQTSRSSFPDQPMCSWFCEVGLPNFVRCRRTGPVRSDGQVRRPR